MQHDPCRLQHHDLLPLRIYEYLAWTFSVAVIAKHLRSPKSNQYQLISLDLRDPSTTPLNFTKSINLALSERGINSMKHAECEGLVEAVLQETIPMHGRMIHGQNQSGQLYEEPQAYDAQGRVCLS